MTTKSKPQQITATISRYVYNNSPHLVTHQKSTGNTTQANGSQQLIQSLPRDHHTHTHTNDAPNNDISKLRPYKPIHDLMDTGYHTSMAHKRQNLKQNVTKKFTRTHVLLGARVLAIS